MFVHALAQGGPRLIEGLPPTLQPNAILLAAPPSDRRLSLLSAFLVYSLIGSGLVVLARDKALLGRGPTGTHQVIILDPDAAVLPRPEPPKVEPVRTAGNGYRPADAPVLAQIRPSDAVPVETPVALPTRDVSHAGQYTADMPVAKDGTGLGVQVQGPAAEPALASAPVQLDLKDVRVLHQVQPVYPGLARLVRAQGPVVLLLTVDPQGVPSDVQALSGPHPSLMAEALRVARLWRFEPARVNGQAVPAQFRLTVVFRLNS